MSVTAHKLSPQFEQRLRSALGDRKPKSLAEDIMRMSDFYLQNPGQPTPWQEAFAVPATLAYFMPLNFVRLNAAFREVERFISPDSIREIWDFGSGLGTTQWVLEDQSWLEPLPFINVEASSAAINMHQQMTDGSRWKPIFKRQVPSAGALGVFSYSFLEMQSELPDLEKFDHLLIVEPSTRDCGRALMEWRARFIEGGYEPLAPCTHSLACPLLTHSPRDWCHHRVHFEAPDWWLEIEAHLPMKNRTLTFSYLVLSRTVRDQKWRSAIRVIGDTLVEKGKTRQMICRGPEREFFSWLHRHGEAPEIAHGALVESTEKNELKGSELRPGVVRWTY